jgi:hypothetical protein
LIIIKPSLRPRRLVQFDQELIHQEKLKQTYNVESETAVSSGTYQSVPGNLVQKGTPLKLAGCVGTKKFKFSEKDNNLMTCDDTNYDFSSNAFKTEKLTSIGCYGKLI